MSQHSPNYKHSYHQYTTPNYQDTSSNYIYQSNPSASYAFPSITNLEYGYSFIGQSIPTQVIKLDSEYRQPIKKVVYGETIRSGAEYKYSSEPCCDECATGLPCASTKPQQQQQPMCYQPCMPMVNQTRTVKYITKKEQPKQQPTEEIQKKLDNLEKLHLQEIQDITHKMEQQFLNYQKQQKADEYNKEINELRSTISELRSKINNPPQQPQQPAPPPPPMMPPQFMMMPPPPQQQQPPQIDRSEIDKLQRKLDKARQKKQNYKNELNNLKQELNQRNSRLYEYQNQTFQSETLQKQLEDQKARNQELVRRYEDAENQLKMVQNRPPQIYDKFLPPPQPEVIVQEDYSRVMALEREREDLIRELEYLRNNFQELGHLRGVLFEKDLNQRDYDLRIRDLVRNVQIMDEELLKLRNALAAKDQIIQSQDKEIQLLRKECNKIPAPTFIETSVRQVPTYYTGYETQYRYQSSPPRPLSQVYVEQVPVVQNQQLPIVTNQQQQQQAPITQTIAQPQYQLQYQQGQVPLKIQEPILQQQERRI